MSAVFFLARSAYSNWVWTPKRKNQAAQQPQAFERWLNGLRLRIEGLFNEIQKVGKNVERLLAKTVRGLCAWIVAKNVQLFVKVCLTLLIWDRCAFFL